MGLGGLHSDLGVVGAESQVSLHHGGRGRSSEPMFCETVPDRAWPRGEHGLGDSQAHSALPFPETSQATQAEQGGAICKARRSANRNPQTACTFRLALTPKGLPSPPHLGRKLSQLLTQRRAAGATPFSPETPQAALAQPSRLCSLSRSGSSRAPSS